MSLSIGILGLTNVGKSTLFQALTKKQVDISNYPFCTIEPNVGVVEVLDSRLEKLAEISEPQKIVPAIIKFVDVAGLIKGAAKGEGLGNQFLAHLRECDALLEIVRCFKNQNISHILGEINPSQDIEIINIELCLKDLETVERRLQKIEKDIKQGDKEARKEFEVLKQLESNLIKRQGVYLEEQDNELNLSHLFLLTLKPKIYVLNCQPEEVPAEFKQKLEQRHFDWIQLDLREELDKLELSKQERRELELSEPKLEEIIKKSYALLDLITFFTIVGNKEVRAWPIKRGSRIIQGAENIHSDFKEKFIQAQVLSWQKVVEAGSWKRCRELGLLKNVGRDYILQDGDVVEIKI